MDTVTVICFAVAIFILMIMTMVLERKINELVANVNGLNKQVEELKSGMSPDNHSHGMTDLEVDHIRY